MRRDASSKPRIERRETLVERDGVRLAVRLILPVMPAPRPCVVFVHGAGSSKDSPRNVVIGEHLVDAGMATLLFDLNGHGESSQDPLGAAGYVDDLAAVWEWVQRQPGIDPARMAVAGSSMGATVAVEAVCGRRIRPVTMVLRAPPCEPGDLDRLHVPALAIIGGADPLAERVRVAAARAPHVTLSEVPGAGHLFEEPGALEQVLERTVGWFRQYLLATEGGP